MKKNWIIRSQKTEPNEALIALFSEKLQIDPLLASILVGRGFTSTEEALSFLHPSSAALHSPFLMENMYEAVETLKTHIVKKSKIGIFADSDLDGLTSLTTIYTLLKKMGCDIFYYFPNNEHSDYGLSNDVVDIFAKEEVALLITVDCGIRDIEEIAYAKEQKIEVLVVDHHEPDENLPGCTIVNPKLKTCSYPFKELAAVGVVFKLCQALLYSYLPLFQKRALLLVKDGDIFYLRAYTNGILLEDFPVSFFYIEEASRFVSEDDHLFYHNISREEIAATKKICTSEALDALFASHSEFSQNYLRAFYNKRNNIGLAPDEIISQLYLDVTFSLPQKIGNYFNEVLPFVAIGTVADVVSVIGENRVLLSHGLQAFNSSNHSTLEKMRTHCNGPVNSQALGWKIAPLLNSPGRFGKTSLTANFFIGESDPHIRLYEEIKELNEYRKNHVAELFQKLINEIPEDKVKAPIIFIHEYELVEGLTGLLASRLVDYYKKPVIVATRTDSKTLKGSGRANTENVLSIITPIQDLFVRFGGHEQAFGFTLASDNVEKLEAYIHELNPSSLESDHFVVADIEIPIQSITKELIKTTEMLEPFGADNERPVFYSSNITFSNFKRFGSANEHGRLYEATSNIEIVGWRMANQMEAAFEKRGASIIYQAEMNEFYGKKNLQLTLLDID